MNSLKSTSKDYVEALRMAADEIILRAEEIIGDIEGQQSINVIIKIDNLAKALKKVYLAFKKEGFTDSQAFTLALTKMKEIEEELNNGKN